MLRRHSSGVRSATLLNTPIPALLIRKSTPPKRASTLWKKRRTSSRAWMRAALEEAAHIFELRDVGRLRQQARVGARLTIFHESLHVLLRSAAYGYRRAFPKQTLRDGPPDPARAACHNRNLAG